MRRLRHTESKRGGKTFKPRTLPARRVVRGPLMGRRARGAERRGAPFVPPETWHEPDDSCPEYRIIVQPPGRGFRHVVNERDLRSKLDSLPGWMTQPLQVVQLSRMTRKKCTAPCYGMQWGAAVYLYPLEEDLTETFTRPPTPAQRIEARMYGGRWTTSGNTWRLRWTEQSARDFYLNNVLIHELGHLLDHRNGSFADRERFAEWFAIEYGYRRSERHRGRRRARRRHRSG